MSLTGSHSALANVCGGVTQQRPLCFNVCETSKVNKAEYQIDISNLNTAPRISFHLTTGDFCNKTYPPEN